MKIYDSRRLYTHGICHGKASAVRKNAIYSALPAYWIGGDVFNSTAVKNAEVCMRMMGEYRNMSD